MKHLSICTLLTLASPGPYDEQLAKSHRCTGQCSALKMQTSIWWQTCQATSFYSICFLRSKIVEQWHQVKADPQCVEIAVERTWKARPFPVQSLGWPIAVENQSVRHLFDFDPWHQGTAVCSRWTARWSHICASDCGEVLVGCGLVPSANAYPKAGICSDTFPKALECVGENARRDEEVAIVVLASLKSSQISVQTLLECKGEACQPGTCVNWCERLWRLCDSYQAALKQSSWAFELCTQWRPGDKTNITNMLRSQGNKGNKVRFCCAVLYGSLTQVFARWTQRGSSGS